MKVKKTKISGSYIITLEKFSDKRGFFSPTWDSNEFKKNGLSSKIVQCNLSFNKKKGTLRGLHYQIKPFREVKLVRCTRGKHFDVALDLRPDSKSYLKWHAVILSADNYKMFYIPEGCAHGFQTLENNTEIFYQVSQFYKPKFARGIRWNDNNFNIKWPLKPTIISEKDKHWETFQPQ